MMKWMEDPEKNYLPMNDKIKEVMDRLLRL